MEIGLKLKQVLLLQSLEILIEIGLTIQKLTVGNQSA